MNDLALTCHPSQPTDVIERFSAGVERDAKGGLHFRYMVQGTIDRIALPPHATSKPTDELWRHTCFEAFITTEDDTAYVECNFSPSTAWAAYRFCRYRTGMAALIPAEPPQITLQTREAERMSESLASQPRGSLVLEARLRFDEFVNRPLRIGLTAVIEDKAGHLSYWAVRHPTSKPDFHHRGGFILRLAAETHTGNIDQVRSG